MLLIRGVTSVTPSPEADTLLVRRARPTSRLEPTSRSPKLKKDPRAWPGWRPPEGGGIVGKLRQSVGNEEIAFAHEQKQNAHEEIAFADEQKQNAHEEIAFADKQKRNAHQQIAFPHEQKRNAREEIAFPDCGRGAKEESRNSLLRVSHRRPSWKDSAPSR